MKYTKLALAFIVACSLSSTHVKSDISEQDLGSPLGPLWELPSPKNENKEPSTFKDLIDLYKSEQRKCSDSFSLDAHFNEELINYSSCLNQFKALGQLAGAIEEKNEISTANFVNTEKKRLEDPNTHSLVGITCALGIPYNEKTLKTITTKEIKKGFEKGSKLAATGEIPEEYKPFFENNQ